MIEDINSHIINKINNNDLNFTKEELYFITINEELLSKLIEYICNHKDINLLDYFDFEALNTITSSITLYKVSILFPLVKLYVYSEIIISFSILLLLVLQALP